MTILAQKPKSRLKRWLVLLCLVVILALTGVIVWSWYHNQKNNNPIPVTTNVNKSEPTPTGDTASPTKVSLSLVISDSLQAIIKPILNAFEQRYANIELSTTYVSDNALPSQTLHPQADMILSDEQLTDIQNPANNTPNIFTYAMQNQQPWQGQLLADDKESALLFRQFLLSSTGQNLLEQQGIRGVEPQQKSLDEIFNSSRLAE